MSIPVTALTQPWWDATQESRLLLQTCASCGHRQHHPRHRCLVCAGEDLGWSASAGTAVVDTVTVVHRSPRPDLDVPYVVARVRLDDGPVMLTNLVGDDPDSWAIGDTVALQWRDLDDGRRLPVWGRPA